jgi:hypothetical protein
MVPPAEKGAGSAILELSIMLFWHFPTGLLSRSSKTSFSSLLIFLTLFYQSRTIVQCNNFIIPVL